MRRSNCAPAALTRAIVSQAYHGQSAAWRWGYEMLRGFACVLQLKSSGPPGPILPCIVSDADIRALTRVAQDCSKPVLERLFAQHMRALAHWVVGRVEEAVAANDQSLRLALRATLAHRAEAMPAFGAGGQTVVWESVGQRIDLLVRCAEKIATSLGDAQLTVDVMEAKYVDEHPEEAFVRLTWPVCMRGAAIGESDADAAFLALRGALRNRKSVCSNGACVAVGANFSCCAKCKMAYYCSPACQRKGWAAHKPQCRAPGEHRVGDVVRLQGLQTDQCLNGQFAEVLQCFTDSGRWLVNNMCWEGRAPVSVKAVCMRRVLWH